MTASVNGVSLTFSFLFFRSHSSILSTLYYIFLHLIILHCTFYILNVLLSFLSFYFSSIPSFLAITILCHLLFFLFLHSFISLFLHLLLTSYFHTLHFHFTNLNLSCITFLIFRLPLFLLRSRLLSCSRHSQPFLLIPTILLLYYYQIPHHFTGAFVNYIISIYYIIRNFIFHFVLILYVPVNFQLDTNQYLSNEPL